MQKDYIQWRGDIPFHVDNFRFYDIEVFKEDFTITFKTIDYSIDKQYVNDVKGLKQYVDDHILVAYNNYHYDDTILRHIIRTNGDIKEIKRLNDLIINTPDNDREMKMFIRKRYPVEGNFKSIDVKNEIVAGEKKQWLSLKIIEANMGKSIVESSVPFDIDRKLTDEEMKEVLEYNAYDVDAVIDVYKEREQYFMNHAGLVNQAMELGNVESWRTFWHLYKRSETALVGIMLENNKKFEIDFDAFDVPDDVIRYWKTAYKMYMDDIENYTNTVATLGVHSVRVGNAMFDFSTGGAHGINMFKTIFDNSIRPIFEPDIQSMYPTIMINYDLLGEKTPYYSDMKEERIRIKHTDEARQQLLKLILNKTFGAFGDRYNKLFNPTIRFFICIKGQEILWHMAREYAKIGDIIQVNTDGVMFQDYKSGEVVEEFGELVQYPTIEEINRKIEEYHNVKLDTPEIQKVIQPNVNNYFASEVPDGTILKGKYASNNGKNYFKDNNEHIINLAAQRHLLYGENISNIIKQNVDNLELFMYNNIISKKYEGIAFFENNNEYMSQPFKDNYSMLWKQLEKTDGWKSLDPNKGQIFDIFTNNIFMCNKDMDDINWSEFKCETNKMYDFSKFAGEWVKENYPHLQVPEKLYKVEPKDYYKEANVKYVMDGRVSRSFAVIENKEIEYGVIRKIKRDENGVAYHAFPSLGQQAAVFNGALDSEEADIIKRNLDLQYYIDRTKDVVHAFLANDTKGVFEK